MSIDIQQLKNELINSINSIDDQSAEELLLLANSVESLSDDRIVAVDTVNDLPELYDIPIGSIFYVRSINVLVISNNFFEWTGLDGRLLRKDALSTLAFSWGINQFGILGDNTTFDRSSPVTVVGGITNWKQLSAGNYSHSLGLTDDGIAYAWGYGSFGLLGTDDLDRRSSPVTVVGGITDWSQVSAGSFHSLGLTDDGIAYAWGYGVTGRLGTDDTISRSSPVTVIGGITNWKQVIAGGYNSFGITENGIAYAWGANNPYGIITGALGDGTGENRSSPVTVVGGITNWKQLSAGAYPGHTLGLTEDGIAYAWGSNSYSNGSPIGKLGDNTGINRSSPVTVVGGITNWKQLSAGNYSHSLGLTDDGILYAWGGNFGGCLGIGEAPGTFRSSPVTVIGGITNWSSVDGGRDVTLGLTDDGIAYVWGSGNYGLLGTDDLDRRSSPVTVIGGITNWTQVSIGQHALGIGDR